MKKETINLAYFSNYLREVERGILCSLMRFKKYGMSQVLSA